jgi:hypothetical protein
VRLRAPLGVLGAGLAVALMGQLGGLVYSMGWSTVLIYGALLLGYLMCLRGQAAAVRRGVYWPGRLRFEIEGPPNESGAPAA